METSLPSIQPADCLNVGSQDFQMCTTPESSYLSSPDCEDTSCAAPPTTPCQSAMQLVLRDPDAAANTLYPNQTVYVFGRVDFSSGSQSATFYTPLMSYTNASQEPQPFGNLASATVTTVPLSTDPNFDDATVTFYVSLGTLLFTKIDYPLSESDARLQLRIPVTTSLNFNQKPSDFYTGCTPLSAFPTQTSVWNPTLPLVVDSIQHNADGPFAPGTYYLAYTVLALATGKENDKWSPWTEIQTDFPWSSVEFDLSRVLQSAPSDTFPYALKIYIGTSGDNMYLADNGSIVIQNRTLQ